MVILNGDIIDIWQFKKRYFPKSHLSVIKKIMDFASNGTEVIYITGNHDEMLRKFTDTTIGNISILCSRCCFGMQISRGVCCHHTGVKKIPACVLCGCVVTYLLDRPMERRRPVSSIGGLPKIQAMSAKR